jgi:hypothetical protein
MVKFKKQTVFFKKTINKNLFLINFLDSIKYDDQISNNLILDGGLYKNKHFFFHNLNNINKNNFFKKELEYTSFDYRYRINKYVNDNRFLILSFFKYNLKRKFKKNKFLSKLTKLPFMFFLNNFEFSLSNILLRSSFFFNNRDVNFFFKNNFFYLNGLIIKNFDQILNVNDILMLSFSKYYFLYYKYTIHNIYNNNKLSNYIFKKNQKNKIDRVPL